VVQYYLVSPAMAAIALSNCGLIDRSTKERWMGISTREVAIRHGWGDQYRSLQADSGRPRAPQRLLARAIAGYREGVVGVEVIADLRGASASEVESELAAAGITQPDE